MKEKIFQFLKTKLTGVQESYLKGIAEEYSKTITEEAQIETMLTQGVMDAIKLAANQIQAEGDRRASDATKTAVKNFREKYNLDENGKHIQEPPKNDPPKGDPEPEWFKAYRQKQEQEIADLMKKQEQEIADLRKKHEDAAKKEVVSALSAKVKAKLAEKKIPETYFKGRSLEVESEEQIDKLVNEISDDYTAFQQDLVNQGVVIEKPLGGGGGDDKSSIDGYLNEKFPKQETK